MGRRITEDSPNILMNFKISPKMKADVDKYADDCGCSSAEWIRRCIQEKLDRLNGIVNDEAYVTHAELREILSRHGIYQSNSGAGSQQTINIGK